MRSFTIFFLIVIFYSNSILKLLALWLHSQDSLSWHHHNWICWKREGYLHPHVYSRGTTAAPEWENNRLVCHWPGEPIQKHSRARFSTLNQLAHILPARPLIFRHHSFVYFTGPPDCFSPSFTCYPDAQATIFKRWRIATDQPCRVLFPLALKDLRL